MLSRSKREDAFAEVVGGYGTTFMLNGCVATCDPAFVSKLLRTKEHSVGRSWVYRLLGNALPSGDGIIFLGDEAWRVRHREFTPALAGRAVKRYSLAMFEAAVSVADLQRGGDGGCARRREDRLASGRPPPLGSTTRPGADLLTMVRWTATRVLLEFAAGADPNTPHAIALGRLMDAYARTAFEVLPGGHGGLIGVVRAYFRLLRLAPAIRASASALVAGGQPDSHDGSNEGKTRDFTDATAPRQPPPRSLLWHMLHPTTPEGAAAFSPTAVASELNHLNGAHKAIALVTSLALFELSQPAHAGVRAALIEELEGVCGRPPPVRRAGRRSVGPWPCHPHPAAGTPGP